MTTIRILKSYLTVLLVGGLITAGMAGCGTVDKHLSEDFGQYYTEGFAAQVANPLAPEDPQPADSLPGEISDQIYQKRYIKSMTEEKEDDNGGQMQNVNTFR
jgi:type IV pilus biogenesis protein CpaD/CtpE